MHCLDNCLLYTVTDRHIAFLVPLSHVTSWTLETNSKSCSLPADIKYQGNQMIIVYLYYLICRRCSYFFFWSLCCLSFFFWSLCCLSFFWSLCCLSFCLLVIVLSVLLSFGHCGVCSSVFWSLCCLSFCLLVIVLSVLLSFGHCVVCPSSFGHCVVCPSSFGHCVVCPSIYGFSLPIDISKLFFCNR